MLPGPCLGLLVTRKSVDLSGKRSGSTRRTQPHIDFIEHAVIGLCGQRGDEPLRKAGEVL